MQRLISFGAGEIGGRVIRAWREAGGEVVACTATDRTHAELRALGVTPHIGLRADLIRPEDALLIALSGSVNQQMAVETLVEAGVVPPARVALTGTTGYYGTPGGLVTVDTPPGASDRAQAAASAEAAFRAWAGDAGVIMRLAGLYRLGKGPVQVLKRRGAPPQGPGDRTLSLIHYEDAATSVFNALRHPNPEPVYVAVTPPLPTRAEFYALACENAGMVAPEFPTEGFEPTTYDLTALRRDVLPEPKWPDWREGATLG